MAQLVRGEHSRPAHGPGATGYGVNVADRCVYDKVYKYGLDEPVRSCYFGYRALGREEALLLLHPRHALPTTWNLSIVPKMPSRRRGQSSTGREDYVTSAYQRLRELIVRGRLAPGTRIIESDVAERLGVSRTPARSAMQRLQQEGYVVAMDGGKQARLSVAPLTEDDARELFFIVGSIEGLAARQAAALAPGAREKLAKELNHLNDELRKEARKVKPSENEIFNLDSAFHRRYVEAAAGPRLLALHDAIKPQAERYVRLYINSLVDEIGSSVEEHSVTSKHVAQGDLDRAQKAVETNWRNAAERLSKVIAVLGERGNW
jgi:DNA-binding GntR family transcriptional regulator